MQKIILYWVRNSNNVNTTATLLTYEFHADYSSLFSDTKNSLEFMRLKTGT